MKTIVANAHERATCSPEYGTRRFMRSPLSRLPLFFLLLVSGCFPIPTSPSAPQTALSLPTLAHQRERNDRFHADTHSLSFCKRTALAAHPGFALHPQGPYWEALLLVEEDRIEEAIRLAENAPLSALDHWRILEAATTRLFKVGSARSALVLLDRARSTPSLRFGRNPDIDIRICRHLALQGESERALALARDIVHHPYKRGSIAPLRYALRRLSRVFMASGDRPHGLETVHLLERLMEVPEISPLTRYTHIPYSQIEQCARKELQQPGMHAARTRIDLVTAHIRMGNHAAIPPLLDDIRKRWDATQTGNAPGSSFGWELDNLAVSLWKGGFHDRALEILDWIPERFSYRVDEQLPVPIMELRELEYQLEQINRHRPAKIRMAILKPLIASLPGTESDGVRFIEAHAGTETERARLLAFLLVQYGKKASPALRARVVMEMEKELSRSLNFAFFRSATFIARRLSRKGLRAEALKIADALAPPSIPPASSAALPLWRDWLALSLALDPDAARPAARTYLAWLEETSRSQPAPKALDRLLASERVLSRMPSQLQQEALRLYRTLVSRFEAEATSFNPQRILSERADVFARQLRLERRLGVPEAAQDRTLDAAIENALLLDSRALRNHKLQLLLRDVPPKRPDIARRILARMAPENLTITEYVRCVQRAFRNPPDAFPKLAFASMDADRDGIPDFVSPYTSRRHLEHHGFRLTESGNLQPLQRHGRESH